MLTEGVFCAARELQSCTAALMSLSCDVLQERLQSFTQILSYKAFSEFIDYHTIRIGWFTESLL